MSTRKNLLAVGASLLTATGLMLSVAAPVSATDAPSSRAAVQPSGTTSFSFETTGGQYGKGTLFLTAKFTFSSPSGFKRGEPVTLTVEQVGGSASSRDYTNIYGTSVGSGTYTIETTAGAKLGTVVPVNTEETPAMQAGFYDFTVPAVGDTSFSFLATGGEYGNRSNMDARYTFNSPSGFAVGAKDVTMTVSQGNSPTKYTGIYNHPDAGAGDFTIPNMKTGAEVGTIIPINDTATPTSQAGFYRFTLPAFAEIKAVNDSATVEQGSSVTIDSLSNDIGDGNELTTVATQPSNGTVEIVDGKFVYTANSDFQGNDSFTYTITDQYGRTATATVEIAVAAVVDGPLIAPAFLLGALALTGAGLGGRALTSRRSTN